MRFLQSLLHYQRIKGNWLRYRSLFSPSMINWPVYAAKAGLAASISIAITHSLHITDTISASFVAVLSTTPTLLGGIRNGLIQIHGSIFGGTIALLCLLLGLHGSVAMFFAIGSTLLLIGIFEAHKIRFVAAFSALYIINLGTSAPWHFYLTRLESVFIGFSVALMVNYLLSFQLYPRLFMRRIRVCRLAIFIAFHEGTSREDAWLEAENLLSLLESEVNDASKELKFCRKSVRTFILNAEKEVKQLKLLISTAKNTNLSQRDLGKLDQLNETLLALKNKKHSAQSKDSKDKIHSQLDKALALWLECRL